MPEVSYGRIIAEKAATPEQVLEAKKAFVDSKRKLTEAKLTVSDEADEATLLCLLAEFPQATCVSVRKLTITPAALTAIAGCSRLVELRLEDMTLPDLTPLAALANLRELSLRYATIPSLAPIGHLPNVEKISLYGAKLDDFSPLAGMPKLRVLDYYASKLPVEKYATLGALKQVKAFEGGLTKMQSLEWVKQVPQATSLFLFAEKYDDFAPISTLVNLEKLTLWSITEERQGKAVGDLQFLAPCVKMKTLHMASSEYTNLAAIGGMKDLAELDISSATKPQDLAVLKSLPKLSRLNMHDCEVSNFEALFGHPALANLNLADAKGVKSIQGLSANKGLAYLTVTEGMFPQDELLAVSNALKQVNRNFRLNVQKAKKK